MAWSNNSKHSSTFADNAKHSSTFADNSKHSSTFADNSKNSSSFVDFLRHGKEPRMEELANYTFKSVVFMDGSTLQNLTFLQLADQVWTNQIKH